MTLPRIELIPLRAAVCSDRPTTLDLVLRIIPPDPPPTTLQRPSLNLGFVVDRSGSMSADRKIDYARKAVCYAIEQLLPNDRFSVTIFDDQVETLIPSTPANQQSSFTRLVKQIRPGGSTSLHAGWVQGGIQVSQSLTAELNRVILLSDGLANVGETNPDTIASDVHGLAQRGISTSTMGLGDDYNEDLLEAMARSGDGNYYYIASAEQLPAIFEQELQGLAATIGRQVAISITPQGEVTVADVLNDLDEDQGRLKLPNLLYSKPIDLVLRLKLPALVQETALCEFHLTWSDSEQQTQELRAILQLPVVNHNQLEEFPLNQVVQQQVALMMAARAKKEAVHLVDQGKYDSASHVLQQARRQMLAFDLPMSAPEADALSDLEQDLKDRKLARYRKRASHQSYSRSSMHSGGHTNLYYALAGEFGWGISARRRSMRSSIPPIEICPIEDRYPERFIRRRPELLAACHQLNGCEPGQAKITPGFGLRAQWVIHTVGPTWQGGHQGEEELLIQCYRNCLNLAVAKGIHSIAFPAISTGVRGFPPDRAAQIAFTTVSQFLRSNTAIGIVRFICSDEATYQHYEAAFERVAGQ
ncbi:macro domain-containing protein [Egbenema bharatensis]|uniref:macro domain-containing protein n=1 Tax=Egbenema bharatensis TaxID=3463334 RepID=UPI003A8A34C7